MFRKVLVANRGEIAVRVIRACRELGIASVAVYSTADRDALHVELADERICIGPPPAEQSYLKIAALVSAALARGCDAIHPGYGFLSENADFAEACQRSGVAFIGPRVRNIKLMGDKPRARRFMRRAGVPVLPGTPSSVHGVDEAARAAAEIGYPVLVKATGGGGGRGLRIVRDPRELEAAIRQSRGEAQSAFGQARVYVEKYLERARHVEFLLDEKGYFYFIEMNTRVQVEHPVTEVLTGIDVVKQGIHAAAGDPLSIRQRDVAWRGHAIECRINAEDPETLCPSPGTLCTLRLPGGPGIRVDAGVAPGGEVPPHYDSLIAKVIAHGADRGEAIARMRSALAEIRVEGIATNVGLHRALLEDRDVVAGAVHTRFLEQWLASRASSAARAS